MTTHELDTIRRLLEQRSQRARRERDHMPLGCDHFWRGYVAGLSYALDAIDAWRGTSLEEVAAELGIELPPSPLDAPPEAGA